LKSASGCCNRRDFLKSAVLFTLTAGAARADVRSFGAKGDGRTNDTAAIQRAIDNSTGTVVFPAGAYPCFSLKLRSHLTLQLESGCTLLAADGNHYDLPEPQPKDIEPYQDYGHNHWHNSLIWGENLDQVAIIGSGIIWGKGLNKGDGPNEEKPGAGNKAIALKNCRNVLLRDLTLRDAGHFGVLASGVDNLTLDNLSIDTRRDGIDIDSCRNVHISNCTVNAPWDDAIVLKSSYSLGYARPTEQVTITNCTVTGIYKLPSPNDQPSFVGRIKIGTETNGDIRNVVVSNCVFEGCHGLAVESEDGGAVEDISFSNITMRNLIGPPFFVRLGARLRGPAGTVPGTIQRVSFQQIDCWNATRPECSILSGVPGHPIRDISFQNIRIESAGGGQLRDGPIPEEEKAYPDPQMFGPTPAKGFFIRHVDGLRMADVVMRSALPDPRPLLVTDDVRNAVLPQI